MTRAAPFYSHCLFTPGTSIIRNKTLIKIKQKEIFR